MARLDRRKSPLDPEVWGLSNVVLRPDLPGPMTRKLYPMTDEELERSTFWLEPNTVEVAGRIRVHPSFDEDLRIPTARRKAEGHATGLPTSGYERI